VSTVTVQLFASYAESFGGPTLEIPLRSDSTVRDLIHTIRSLPGSHVLPEFPRVAVNRKFALPGQLISSRDEIALIPPMAGG
jgi:molybdopterin converting factor small subunit